MASILRSSKFVRYIVGFTRNITINPFQVREFDNTTIQNGQCLCNILTRSLASQITAQHTQQNDQSLERSLRRLDQDARRSGRISRRDLEDVLEEIRTSRSASSSQSLLIIRCCGNLVPEERPEIRTQLVQEIWQTLNKLNVPMDVSHYNALLRVYLENEYEFSPIEFLTELEKAGIEPNRVTYQRLITRYCQNGDIEGATKILEYMREKEIPVNESIFNSLIMGHSQADDMESAKGILNVMKQAGLEPSADTYTTLLCGFAKKGDIDSIREIMKTCEEKEISLLDKDLMDIIYALTIHGHGQHVPEILAKMKKSLGYNQDCINLILKLINKGHEDIALEVLKTMPRGKADASADTPSTGGFFINQMVKAKRPVEKIISICNYLQTENLNPRALLIAADASLKQGNVEIAIPIFNEMKKQNLPIRPHYFWPLIIAEGQKRGNEGIFDVLHKMISDFDLTISGETLRDYVIPNLKFDVPDQCILSLRDVGVSVASAATNLVHHYLVKNDLASAANVASRYTAHYSPNLLKRPLTMAYLKTGDAESYVKVVRQIHDNLRRIDNVLQTTKPESAEEASSSETDATDRFDEPHVVGQMVVDVAVLGRQKREENVRNILRCLVNEGLSISSQSADRLQDLLGGNLTPDISTLLGKLTSGELTPAPFTKPSMPKPVSTVQTVAQLERSIKTAEEKGENVNGLKRQLLSIHCKNRDVEKVESLLNSLKDFEFTPGIYAQLIDLYATVENLDKALLYKQKLQEKDPNFMMDDVKAIKLVTLLVKNDRLDEAIEFVKAQSRERKLEERTFNYNSLCWRLLTHLAEEGKAEELKKLFDVLVEKEYIEPTNVMLGPLIKVHLVNNDLEKAMEEFERCCREYRATPYKNELTCRLIQNEDANNLQKLTDLSTQIHGEVNSLYDLVFAFVECGRIRQARKILETPGLRSRQQRVDTVCERYSQEGQADPLEGLIEATKDLHHIDRSNIFLHLLNTYIKQDKAENALGLWTRMQEEDTQPTDEFLYTLGNYLKSKNMKVPFVIPDIKPPKPVIASKSAQTTTEKVIVPNEVREFRNALRNSELDKALELKNKISVNQLSLMDQSSLIESLVKADRLNEAKKEVFNMISKNTYPIPRVFRFFLNKLALAGDVDTLKMIGETLKPELKKLVSFDNKLCHANIVAGKSNEFLSALESVIDNAQDDQLSEIATTFPRGGVMGILDSHPELIPRFEEICKKYADRGIIAPANVLWMKYFIANDTEGANRVWDKYLKDSPRLMFQRVVQHSRENKDDALVRRLIDVLKQTKVTEGAFGNAYSCLIDVLVAKEKYEEALKEVQAAMEYVCLENINRTALLRLKDGLNKIGKPFPLSIPAKNSKSSSSSSSSDDEKK